jgi:hypothetical protein
VPWWLNGKERNWYRRGIEMGEVRSEKGEVRREKGEET